MKSRYPLKALEQLSEKRVSESRTELRLKLEEVRRTAQFRERCQHELAEARQESTRTLDREATRLDCGHARAVDLVRGQEFRHGAHEREESLAQRLNRARSEEAMALSAERDAREQLAKLEAEAQALKRHKQRFDQAALRAAEQEQEELALEVHAHRARRERA